MTARPGVQVVMKAAPPNRGPGGASGVAFFAGLAERGRTDRAVLIHNMDEYATYFGNRVSYGLLYDACDAAFASGMSSLYVGRVVGPAATVATHTFNDGAGTPGPSIAVDTLGQFASTWTAQVVAGAGGPATASVIVRDAAGNLLTQSPEFALPADFANWSQSNNFIRIRALGTLVPAVAAATALAGGTDDRASVTDTVKLAALPVLFPTGFGPGQVAYPGATTTAMHIGLLAFADASNRVALLDMPDTASDTTLKAEADAIRAGVVAGSLDETFGIALAPWHIVPGIATGTTRTVPPSAVTAGLIAASDGKYDNPNIAAAGANGISNYIIGLSQPSWSDTVRTSLNDAGISVYREMFGSVRLYGYRTLADPKVPASKAWDSFASARVRMAIAGDLGALGEEFLFDQLDGQGKKIAEFNGACSGVLLTYWSKDALYGESAADSFIVDTGPTVNTPDTIQDRQLRVKCGIKTSPFAELAYFEVTKVALTEEV